MGVLVYETKGYNNSTNALKFPQVDLLIQQSSGVPSGTYFYILNYTSVDNNGKL
jgi:hypothetical protein